MESSNSQLDSSVLEYARSIGFHRYLPFLTDEQVMAFETDSTNEEKLALGELFGVEEVFNAKPGPHILATSIFWKHANRRAQILPHPTMDLLQNAWKLGIATRYDPWKHYVLPVIHGAQRLSRIKPEVTVRVYLARDLAFLIPTLTMHCEVYLMRHSSILHNPGAMWRFLAMEDAPNLVTIIDSDLMDNPARILKRTEESISQDLASWRVPRGAEIDRANYFIYRPIMANGFGTRFRLPISKLANGFVWHCQRNTFPPKIDFPDVGSIPQFGSVWPGYGMDELFLAMAVYPRLLPHGFTVLCGQSEAKTLFPLDISLTRTANARSRHLGG